MYRSLNTNEDCLLNGSKNGTKSVFKTYSHLRREVYFFFRFKQWPDKDERVKYNGHRKYFDILFSKVCSLYQIIANEILISFTSV